ncbi:hypothetical protein D3C86_1520330 [compost metagenome]
MVGLAVGNHFFVFADPELLQDLRHVRANAQVARRIHARGPFEIDRAGNVSCLGRQDFLAGVLQRSAGVPDRQVGRAETALQVLAGSDGFVVQGQGDRAADRRRDLDRHGQTFRQPGLQTAVDIVVVAMADNVQQPDKASGPTAAFVVIDDVDRVGVVSQFAEQCFKRSLSRQQARRRRLAQLRTLGIDKAGTGYMPFGITGAAGQVHQDKFAGFETGEQLARLDHQGQAREVRHVRSPEHKGLDCSAAFSGRGG